MRRREFITLLGGAAAWPVTARAQLARMRRVGVLMNTSADDQLGRTFVDTFVQALGRLGWVLERSVQIDARWASGNAETFKILANELVSLNPDVVLGASNLAATALRQTGASIPVVFTQTSDPIGRGLVANLARPGGLYTGFSNFETSMGSKWLDMLKEIFPDLAVASFLYNPETSPHIASGFYLKDAESAGRQLAIKTLPVPLQSTTELGPMMRRLAQEKSCGLIVLPDAFTLTNIDQIVALAARDSVPAIYSYPQIVSLGGLVSYGIDVKQQYLGAANYVDRILRGEKPGDLPVQGPTKFVLAINLKTAKALGLDLPPTLLARADEVIE
jgi:ABC-type uncharacterized transport system substrate-binding protein